MKSRNFEVSAGQKRVWTCGKPVPNPVYKKNSPEIFHKSLWTAFVTFPPKSPSKNSTTTAFVALGQPKTRFSAVLVGQEGLIPEISTQNTDLCHKNFLSLVLKNHYIPKSFPFSTVSTPTTDTTSGILKYSHVWSLVDRRAYARVVPRKAGCLTRRPCILHRFYAYIEKSYTNFQIKP